MHTAKIMTLGAPLPTGAVKLGYIDRHPADRSGLGYTILRMTSTGVEIAWDGQRTRSLPANWRDRCEWLPWTRTAPLGWPLACK